MKNIIRELRAELGWSQAALADRLDVSRQTIHLRPDVTLRDALASYELKGLD